MSFPRCVSCTIPECETGDGTGASVPSRPGPIGPRASALPLGTVGLSAERRTGSALAGRTRTHRQGWRARTTVPPRSPTGTAPRSTNLVLPFDTVARFVIVRICGI